MRTLTAMQSEIKHSIEDEDAVIFTTYDVRVTYTKCDGFPETWGYDGGCPGEPDHVDDVLIAEVLSVQIGDEKPFRPQGNEILDTLRKKFGSSEAITDACFEDAFGQHDCGYDDRDD